jgi:hypothetical protein
MGEMMKDEGWRMKGLVGKLGFRRDGCHEVRFKGSAMCPFSFFFPLSSLSFSPSSTVLERKRKEERGKRMGKGKENGERGKRCGSV